MPQPTAPSSSSAPAYPAFGEFVKTQRALAQLSLRQASAMARISNPYLSQIEHGWVLPSVAVMSKLADAFSVSAEALLMEAAVAASGSPAAQPSTEEAIQRDARLGVEEKKALLLILESFTRSETAQAPAKKASAAKKTKAPVKKAPAKKAPVKKAPAAKPRAKASDQKRRPTRASMSANISSTTPSQGSR